MRVRALIDDDDITKGKVYPALADNVKGVVILDDRNDRRWLDTGKYEIVTFEPGEEDYFIRVKDERHYEYVGSLAEHFGYTWIEERNYNINNNLYNKPTKYLLLNKQMDIARLLDASEEGYIEITTDDLLWYEAEPTAEDVLADILLAVFLEDHRCHQSEAEAVISALNEAGYEIVRKSDE